MVELVVVLPIVAILFFTAIMGGYGFTPFVPSKLDPSIGEVTYNWSSYVGLKKGLKFCLGFYTETARPTVLGWPKWSH